MHLLKHRNNKIIQSSFFYYRELLVTHNESRNSTIEMKILFYMIFKFMFFIHYIPSEMDVSITNCEKSLEGTIKSHLIFFIFFFIREHLDINYE